MLPYQRERSAAAVDIVLQEVLMHKYFLLPFILVTVSFILNCVNNWNILSLLATQLHAILIWPI